MSIVTRCRGRKEESEDSVYSNKPESNVSEGLELFTSLACALTCRDSCVRWRKGGLAWWKREMHVIVYRGGEGGACWGNAEEEVDAASAVGVFYIVE